MIKALKTCLLELVVLGGGLMNLNVVVEVGVSLILLGEFRGALFMAFQVFMSLYIHKSMDVSNYTLFRLRKRLDVICIPCLAAVC